MTRKSEWRVAKTQAESRNGMVATMYPQASEAGIAVLEAGGNAVDAAVAAGFAVGVVEPFNSGLGGIAVMVYYEAATGKTHVIDGTGTLPAATRPDQFRIADPSKTSGIYSWPAVDGDANQTGYMSAAVPGMPACLTTAHDMFGRKALDAVMAPAVALAEDGYPVDWYVTLGMAINQDRLHQFPESKRTFYRPDGSCYRAPMLSNSADTLRQPDLARTLREIAQDGADAFYRGRVADLIAKDMAENGGLISYDDMANYRPRVSEGGIAGTYRGYDIIGGLENTGFPTVLQALNLLEGFDLAGMVPGSAEELHLIAEMQRLAFIDRFAHLADAGSADVPLDGLLSKGYAADRRQAFDPARAATDAIAGDPWPHNPTQPGERLPASVTNEGQTTHLTVIDKDHNMVSLLSTLGMHFGSGVVAKDTGVVLNDGTMWFDPVPGRINSLAPGRRIMTAGAPTIVLRDGKPVMTIGAPGGRRVISSLIHSIVNVLDHAMGPQEGLNTPRVHCEGGKTDIDVRVGNENIASLGKLGHDLQPLEETFSSTFFGRPNAIVIDRKTGTLQAGVNQLKPAQAIGF